MPIREKTMKLENYVVSQTKREQTTYYEEKEELSNDVLVKMTFCLGSRPMAEVTHNERQHIGKEGCDSRWSNTGSDSKDAFPDIGRFCKTPECRYLFNCLDISRANARRPTASRLVRKVMIMSGIVLTKQIKTKAILAVKAFVDCCAGSKS
jgi:hypothetical protein